MEWSIYSKVPVYYVRGMTFESLLDAHKQFIRDSQPCIKEPVGMEDDDDIIAKKTSRSLGINRKQDTCIKKRQAPLLKSRASLRSEKSSTVYSSRRPTGCVSVLVRNIPFSASDNELRDHFNHIEGIISARIDRGSAGSLGTGSILCTSAKNAQLLVDSMQNSFMSGRPIKVSLKG